ncbi:MAG: ABC transporter ATP-binding protein [Bacteroidales bacterium]|nr:ABC transporter ATP-binding protein [Bacteroidales bacterium]
MIDLIDIRKSYGELKVLDGVSLRVEEGETVAVVGPSGAGKTTLLQIAGTLDRPDSGIVRYDGRDITSFGDKRLSEFRNRNIGFVFQFHQLLPEFTAQENVALPALIAGENRSHAMNEAARLLDMLGLSERLLHKPAAMSGGERQRTAIARALINNPRVVLADEPTGSLDSHNREEIQNIFIRLREELGQTFVMVTHDPSLALIAHHIVTMTDGHIDTVQTDNNISNPE